MLGTDLLDNIRTQHPDFYSIIERYQLCFGSTFIDVLEEYRVWRSAKKAPTGFLDQRLSALGISQWWPNYPARVIERLLQKGTVLLWINDDNTIATALAQRVVDHKIIARTRSRALVCLNRQLTRSVLNRRGYDNPTAALDSLAEVKAWIESRS